MSNTRVKTHTRTSKNGKTHRVKSHQRETSLGDLFRSAKEHVKNNKGVGAAALGASAWAAISYTLYGVFSLAAAIMCAIGLVSAGFIGWAAGKQRGKRRKKSAWKNWTGVLSPRRRVKVWWHGKKKTVVGKAVPKFVKNALR